MERNVGPQRQGFLSTCFHKRRSSGFMGTSKADSHVMPSATSHILGSAGGLGQMLCFESISFLQRLLWIQFGKHGSVVLSVIFRL